MSVIKKYYPSIIIVPGETISDHMMANNMTQKDLALRLGISKEHLNKIINGKKKITTELAIGLENVFGSSAGFWINLEINHQENLKRLKLLEDIDENEEIKIMNRIPYDEMCKLKWIEKFTEVNDKIDQLRKYFRVSNLTMINEVYECAFRVQANKKVNEYAQAAWVSRGVAISNSMQTENFDKDKLINSIKKMRASILTDDLQAFRKLNEICNDCGIALIIEKSLKDTYVHGVTKWLSPTKAMISLSLRYSYSDIVWFSFFHEIAHILKHGKRFKYNEVTAEEENEANIFAENILIPRSKYMNFIQNNIINSDTITKFAYNLKIPTGVVVGRLANEKIIKYGMFSDLRNVRFKFKAE